MPPRTTTYPLIPVHLTQVTTVDGIELAGVVVEPRTRKKRVALIWLHGLTSSFDSGQRLMGELSAYCKGQGIGYFKFNTRGHHLVDYGSSRIKRLAFVGATHERFQDSLKDIRAVIALAKRRGYRRIILAGHSTGAQKALYYAVRAHDPSVIAVLLAGPASDIAGELQKIRPSALLQRVALAKRRAIKHPDELVPTSWGPWSNARYVSLFTPGSVEEVFPYHRLGGNWTFLRRVRVPVFMISGEHDQYLTAPAKVLMEKFATIAVSTKQFTGVVVPGANHGFHGQHRAVVQAIATWLPTVL